MEAALEFAIIEPTEVFGGGNLQSYYGIRSNTSAHGFLKVIQYPKPKKLKNRDQSAGNNNLIIKKKEYSSNNTTSSTNQGINTVSNQTQRALSYQQPVLKIQVIQGSTQPSDKNQLTSSTINASYVPQVMTGLLPLSTTDIAQYLRQTGKAIAPLQIIGSFLSFAGNQMLFDIYSRFNKKIFYPYHKAKSIQVNHDGTFSTQVEKQTYEIVQDQDQRIILKPKIQTVTFHSKNVILACGGKQKTQQKATLKKYEISPQCQVFNSDEMLREQKFRSLVNLIKEKKQNITITIIGGSHSAFSIAWLLLNGPCKIREFRNTQSLQSSQCQKCNSCPLGITHKKDQTCICQQECCCLSRPSLPRAAMNEIEGIDFPCIDVNRTKVQILYRDKIKVYYNSVVLAQADQYTDYDNKLDVSKGGIVFPFTGIRGDAKELYRKIKKGLEPRIQLIRADTTQEQKFYTRNSDVVIFACGYTSNHIPIFDPLGNKIELRHLGSSKLSTVEVDNQCKIVSAATNKPIDRLFGIGIGYSLKTTDNLVQAEQRSNTKADSVGLYIKQIGHKLLPQLFNSRPRTQSSLTQSPQQPQLIVKPTSSLSIAGGNSIIKVNQVSLNLINNGNNQQQSQKANPKAMMVMTPQKTSIGQNSAMIQMVQDSYYDKNNQMKGMAMTMLRESRSMQRQMQQTSTQSFKKKRQSSTAMNNGFNLQPSNVSQSKQVSTHNSLIPKMEVKDTYDLQYWQHKSPEIKKGKLLINTTNQQQNLLSSTQTTPLKTIFKHQSKPIGIIPQLQNYDQHQRLLSMQNINGKGGSPLKERLKNVVSHSSSNNKSSVNGFKNRYSEYQIH